MKLTAKTITDAQIVDLREALFEESGNQMTAETDATGMALGSKDPVLREICRERCAEILNAREVVPK